MLDETKVAELDPVVTTNGNEQHYCDQAGVDKRHSTDQIKEYVLAGIGIDNNVLVNQDLSIWQENTTFTNPGNNVYTADGWYMEISSGGGTSPTVNVKKNITDQDTGFAQCCELEITNVGSFSGGFHRFTQAVEDYKKYGGKKVTATIRIKASTALTTPNGLLWAYDGVTYVPTPITSIGTGWIEYSNTITIGAAPTQLRIGFDLGAGISGIGSIYIQWAKIEIGSVATPLIPRRDDKDLDLSQRNYQKTYAQGTFPGTATEVGAVWQEVTAVASADHTITIDVKFPKVMKAAPTITLYDLAGNSGRVTMAAGNNIVGTVSQISDSGFKISATNGATSTSRKLAFHYTAISRV